MLDASGETGKGGEVGQPHQLLYYHTSCIFASFVHLWSCVVTHVIMQSDSMSGTGWRNFTYITMITTLTVKHTHCRKYSVNTHLSVRTSCSSTRHAEAGCHSQPVRDAAQLQLLLRLSPWDVIITVTRFCRPYLRRLAYIIHVWQTDNRHVCCGIHHALYCVTWWKC